MTEIIDQKSSLFSYLCSIDVCYFYRLLYLFNESVLKLNQAVSFCKILHEGRDMVDIKVFLMIAKNYKCDTGETIITGPAALNRSYYFDQGGWETDAYFLFGTPYQHRCVT